MNYLKELADKIHANAINKGFWNTELSNEHCLCLVVSELMEAVEADRKQKYADVESFKKDMDIFTPEDSPYTFEHLFNIYIKDSISDEIADAFIRLLDLAGARHLELHVADIPDEQCKSLATDYSFTENLYYLIGTLTKCDEIKLKIEEAMYHIINTCKAMEIDLLWHVELKMKYNELRPYLHGKQY